MLWNETNMNIYLAFTEWTGHFSSASILGRPNELCINPVVNRNYCANIWSLIISMILIFFVDLISD